MPSVAIVGAGIAGLAAAQTLLHHTHKYQVTLFEASPHIGGRTRSVQFGSAGTIVDLGAHWIHGIEDNPIAQLALRYGVIDKDTPLETFWDVVNSQYVILGDSGRGLNVTHEQFSRYQNLFTTLSENMLEYAKTPLNLSLRYNDSFGLFIREHFFKNISTHEKDVAEAMFHHLFLERLFYEAAGSLDDVSITSQCEYFENDGNIGLDKGYSPLIEAMAKDVGKERIRVNRQVKKVELMENGGVSLSVIANEDRCDQFFFDHVILSIPLGALRRSYRSLLPPLPAYQAEAIDAGGIGMVEKIFLEFATPLVPAGTTLLHTIYSTDEVVRGNWVTQIPVWYCIDSRVTIIMGVTCGKAAIEMCKDSPEEVGRKCYAALETFFKLKLPPLKNILRTEWHLDENIGGSYSYCPPHSLHHIRAMSQPLCAPNKTPLIMFAGEHTHENQFATTQGAYNTGVREANRLIDFYSNSFASKL